MPPPMPQNQQSQAPQHRHPPQPQNNQQIYHHLQPQHYVLPQNSTGPIFLPTGAQFAIYSRPNVLPPTYGATSAATLYHPQQYMNSYAQQQTMPPLFANYYNQQNMVIPARGGPPAAAAINVPPPPAPAAPPANSASLSLLQPQVVPTQTQYQPAVVTAPTYNKINGRRPNALQIIDPDTGEDKLTEVLKENLNSGESTSARQTPTPAAANSQEVKLVQATFAKMVAQAINSDEKSSDEVQQTKQHHLHHQQNLQDSTPVVSANSDSTAEVIFLKDRGESPNTKIKKQQLNAAAREHKQHESKETLSNKEEIHHSAPHVTHPDVITSAKVTSPVSTPATGPPALIKQSPPPKLLQKEMKEVAPVSSLHITNVHTAQPVQAQLDDMTVMTPEPVAASSVQQIQNLPEASIDVSTSDASAVSAAATTITMTAPCASKPTKPNQKNKQQIIEGQAHQSSPSLPTVAQATPSDGEAAAVASSPVTVPSPQPKSANKTNKSKKELNMKGASKEGTDMDAFNDIDNKQISDINETSAAENISEVNTPLEEDSSEIVSNVNNNNINNNATRWPLKTTATPNIKTEVFTNSSNDNIKDDHGNNLNVSNINPTITHNSNNNIMTSPVPTIPGAHIPGTTSIGPIITGPPPGLPPTIVTNLPFAKPSIGSSSTKPPTKPFDVTSIVKDMPKVVVPTSTYAQQPHISKNAGDDLTKFSTTHYFSSNKDFLPTSAAATENDNNLRTMTTKVNENTTVNEPRMKLSYKPGHWSPDNQQGERIYERDLLLSIKILPDSNKKPHSLLLDSVNNEDKYRLLPSLSGRSNDFSMSQQPSSPYISYGGGGVKSQRGSVSKRGSQSGKIGGGNNASRLGSNDKNQANKSQAKVSISLREEVKLHQVENAWKPSRLNAKAEENNEEEQQTRLLYKQVRSILNKLTPQKFEILIAQFRQLPINTPERLTEVINLIFDKATDEPNFSLFYAKMCKEIHFTYPQASTLEDTRKTGFRSLLVRRCQTEFEKSSIDETKRNNKVKEIEECTDSDKKKELEFELEEYDTKLRRKSLGTIRFIGELFKQSMLTSNIMSRCLHTLLNNNDEESLECLCKLITTVGPEMDESKNNLGEILHSLKMIADNSVANANNNNNSTSKRGQQQQAAPTMKVNSRLRFMIQDVIELRGRKWASRRPDASPKTMDQIVKDIDNEQHQQHSANLSNNNMLSSSSSLRKDVSRGIGGGGSGSMSRQQRMPNSDGWNAVSSSGSKKQFIQTEKMRVAMPEKETLGSSDQFGTWSKGAAGSSSINKNPQLSYFSNNSYHLLENYDSMDKRPPMRSNRSKDYSSQKDGSNSSSNSIERSNFSRSSGSAPRHHQQHQQQQQLQQPLSSSSTDILPTSSQSNVSSLRRNNANSSSTNNNNNNTEDAVLPPPAAIQSKTITAVPATNINTEVVVTLNDDDDIGDNKFDGGRFANGLQEIIEYPQTLDAYLDEIKEKYLSSRVRHSEFVFESLYTIMEKSQPLRLKCGEVFCIYLNKNVISLKDFYSGLERFREEINDIIIDVPQVWKFLAEIIAAAVAEEQLPLTNLHIYLTQPSQPVGTETKDDTNGSSELSSDYNDKYSFSSMPSNEDIQLVLKTIFDFVIKEKSVSYLRNLLQTSGLKLEQFLQSEENVKKFIEKNKFECLISGSSSLPNQLTLDTEKIREKLLEFFKRKTPTEEIITWISTNVGDENTTENIFLRVLATAIYEDSICKEKLVPENLIENSKLIQKYVDYKVDYEIQCLVALHTLLQRLQHPKGLLLEFCNTLYDNSILSKDAFINWGKDKDPSLVEGRGVILYQLNAFFTQLRENEDEK